jgi:Domain of unknown function (DUF5666)
MQLTFEPARLTGFAILAVAGATALSVGACSSSKNAKSPATSSPATSSPASAKAQGVVQGLIASVSGNSAQVTEKSGAATVDFSPSTKVIEYSNAQLTDVAVGNCVRVNFEPAPPPGGAGTATAVQLNPSPGGDGKCPQPKTLASGSPGALLPAGPLQAVVGTVASVAGNTISVTNTDANGNPSQTEVTVTDKTQYQKGISETSQAIAQGKCINASGTKDSGGTLQAWSVDLGPVTNGGCPQFGVKGQQH